MDNDDHFRKDRPSDKKGEKCCVAFPVDCGLRTLGVMTYIETILYFFVLYNTFNFSQEIQDEDAVLSGQSTFELIPQQSPLEMTAIAIMSML